jgi:hypothetical protein
MKPSLLWRLKKIVTLYTDKFRLRPSSRFSFIRQLYWQRLAKHRMQERQVIHFLHQRKAGGTALKHALAHQRVTKSHIIEYHQHDVTLNMIPLGDKFFFFARDPITRFISGFNSRKRLGYPATYRPWSDREKFVFAHFETPNQLALSLSATDAVVRSNTEKAMNSIDHIKYSHWDCFHDEAYFRSRFEDILFIGFQEQFSDDVRILGKLLKLDEEISLPADPGKANRAPIRIESQLDEQAYKNLQSWYARDIYFIELCREFRKLKKWT